MKTPTAYQREIAAAVAADLLHGRGSVFTVEAPLGAGVRELAWQLEMLALSVNAQAGGSLLRVVSPDAPASQGTVKERLAASLRESAPRGLWSVGDADARLGRARAVYAAPEQLEGLEGRFEMAQALDAHRLSAEAVERLQGMADSGATVVLYGRPRDGATPFERLKLANREAEASAGRKHFRVTPERAQAELPGYAARVAAAREELGEAHSEIRDGLRAAPRVQRRPRLPGDPLARTARERRAPPFGRRGRTRRVGRAHAAAGRGQRRAEERVGDGGRDGGVAPRSGVARSGPQVAEAADTASLARCVARFTEKTWPCERVIVRSRAERSEETRRLLDDALGARRARWAPNDAGRRERESSALIAAALTGRLSLYAADGSPEYRALRREMESAALRPGAEGGLAAAVNGPDEGFMEGLSILVEEDAERGGPRLAALPDALAS